MDKQMALDTAIKALRQYEDGKTWQFIAKDALEEIEHMGSNIPDKQYQVIQAILKERTYQDDKWGALWYRDHPVSAWLLILEQELNEAKKAWVSKEGDQVALIEILQVAATAFACLEQHGIVERDHE